MEMTRKACARLTDLGLPPIYQRQPLSKSNISSAEIMEALDWQMRHPYHEMTQESAETVALALRKVKTITKALEENIQN